MEQSNITTQTSTEPAIDLSRSPIVQIGVVVAHAVRTACNTSVSASSMVMTMHWPPGSSGE